ncbi:MAG: sulfatase-like hydrolase/transferase [Acidobacteria bacterium]|nr:sulfatase-like hydrolase/transferase [Acidobacteriota bacterium]
MLIRTRLLRRALLAAGLVAVSQVGGPTPAQAVSRPPNILFIILDDVGKDQLAAFNPLAPTAALTPNLNAIVAAGVKFTNLYTMPECSPSRATFFTGRYPQRTGVTAAILDQNLTASQLSPFEVTTPQVLAAAGYRSALIGKYHLGGPANNPDGVRAPLALGWDFFNGNSEGYPPAIDSTLGGQYTRDTTKYSCGFPTGTERGAAWFQDAAGHARCDDNQRTGYTGQQAVARGGIPALDAEGNFAPSCREAAGAGPDFTRSNGYYVWPQVIADARSVRTATSRQYMTTAQTDAAIAWVRGHSEGNDVGRPWMATVSYNAIHTSYQLPPADLYPPGFVWPSNVPESCSGAAADPILSDLMLGALDHEIGRLLRGIGLAEGSEGGPLVYRPEATDTMVVIVGDNGTFYPGVKAPYDPIRAKGTAYETGVLTPLMVSGPLVVGPGRSVDHMVSSVDLFQLFGEVAGVDVRKAVPASHALDAEPMLAYLTNPSQPSVRRTNFTQLGLGLLPPSVKTWPCVLKIGPAYVSVDYLYASESQCVQGDGTWYGPSPSQPAAPYPNSCAVRAAGLYPSLAIGANQVWALRNSRYKLVKLDRAACDSSLGEYEFYDLSARTPTNPLGIDLAATNLLTNGQPVGLTTEQMANFGELSAQLQEQLASEPACYGDGNLDKRVDDSDWRGVLRYWGQPSVFDVNLDGTTDGADLQCVKSNFGRNCRVQGPGTACK